MSSSSAITAATATDVKTDNHAPKMSTTMTTATSLPDPATLVGNPVKLMTAAELRSSKIVTPERWIQEHVQIPLTMDGKLFAVDVCVAKLDGKFQEQVRTILTNLGYKVKEFEKIDCHHRHGQKCFSDFCAKHYYTSGRIQEIQNMRPDLIQDIRDYSNIGASPNIDIINGMNDQTLTKLRKLIKMNDTANIKKLILDNQISFSADGNRTNCPFDCFDRIVCWHKADTLDDHPKECRALWFSVSC